MRSGGGTPGARALGAAVVLALPVLALWAGACAKVEAPSGGPEDKQAPTVSFVSPADGAGSVPRDAQVSVAFSEPMDQQSVEDWTFLTPHLPIGTRTWKGSELTLSFREPFDTSATYVLLVGTGAKDRRGNALAEPLSVVFTAGVRPALGSIAGTLQGVKQKTSGLQVWAYNVAGLRGGESDSGVPDFANHDPDRIAQSDAKGDFHLRGLDPGASYLVYALVDVDGNRRYSPDKDIVSPADSAVIARVEPPSITITVVHPREPGAIAGTVEDARCGAWRAADTLGTALRSILKEIAADSLAEARRESLAASAWTRRAAGESLSAPGDTAAADSARERASVGDTLGLAAARAAREAKRAEIVRALAGLPEITTADTAYCSATLRVEARADADTARPVRTTTDRDGHYTISGLAPGAYRLDAFRDLDGDGVPSRGEPASTETTAVVRPGRTTDSVDVAIR